jgi:hypothetical protein
MGNTLVQAMTDGRVRDLPALRRVVAASCELRVHESSADWDAAYARYARLCCGS